MVLNEVEKPLRRKVTKCHTLENNLSVGQRVSCIRTRREWGQCRHGGGKSGQN